MKPFFLLGCPRSGTTVIREFIKSQTNLISPEETFYYRWSFPFGSTEYLGRVNSPLAQKHRQLDGINESEFQALLESSHSRKELLLGHVRLMGTACGGTPEWFEKTPQHVYAAPLIISDFPESGIVFIFRHPLNACASLYSGKQLNAGSLNGAIQYWNEAFSIYRVLKKISPNVILISYEEFTQDPGASALSLLSKLGWSGGLSSDPTAKQLKVHQPIQRHKEILSVDQVHQVLELCREGMDYLGYTSEA